MKPVRERGKGYVCGCTADLPFIGPPGRGVNGRRSDHIPTSSPIVQAGSKTHRYSQGWVITLEVIVGTSATGQTSPGFGERTVLPFQFCKGFIPILPRVVVCVYI